MGFKCGIVGLPNVGKSSLFNALTRAAASAENYPFCTIDPNVGVVAVPDERLNRLCDIVQPKRRMPAQMEFVDIAGLVEGAAEGEGLGNQFLAHIRETQAIALVTRCFEDENITHVTGRIDPAADIELIHTELALADLATVEKALVRHKRRAGSGDKQAQQQIASLVAIQNWLSDGKPVRDMELGVSALKDVAELHLLTSKPVLYVANVDEASLNGNVHSEVVENIARKSGAVAIRLCAAIEAEIATLDEDGISEFLAELGIVESGLNLLIKAGYELLMLETFFTAGPKECRAWTIPKSTCAPQAAGVIHTDFERGFIRAEVIGYQDYIVHNGEQGARDAGKWRLEGRDYTVRDGDVIEFRFNV